jgi:outer membrane immunogenic protein
VPLLPFSPVGLGAFAGEQGRRCIVLVRQLSSVGQRVSSPLTGATMKRFLFLSTIAFAITTGPALAADSCCAKAPSPPAAPNWTGFYIGANAGWGRATSDILYVPPGPPFTSVPSAYSAIGSGDLSSDGFIGGGQLGFNFQYNSIVLGIEADIDSFSRSAGFTNTGTPAGAIVPLTSVASVSANGFATVRGRAGLALQSWLFYFTAGEAETRFNFNQVNTYNVVSEAAAISETLWGPVYGGGVEYLVGRNWTVKAEYLHADFGTVSQLVPFLGQDHSHSADLSTDIVRAGINYKFDFTAPAVGYR